MAKELNNTYLVDDSNLQGYWRLESDGTDTSSNSYTLTGVNTPAHAAGLFGNGFDAESTTPTYYYIADASCANLKITGSFTLLAWVKPESLSASGTVISKDPGSATGGYSLTVLSTGAVRVVYRDGTDTQLLDSNTGWVATGGWYFVAGVFDTTANTLTVYSNGQYKVETGNTTDPADTTENFAIGVRYTGTASPFDGIIDDAAVFDRALSVDELNSLYRGSPRVTVLV